MNLESKDHIFTSLLMLCSSGFSNLNFFYKVVAEFTFMWNEFPTSQEIFLRLNDALCILLIRNNIT